MNGTEPIPVRQIVDFVIGPVDPTRPDDPRRDKALKWADLVACNPYYAAQSIGLHTQLVEIPRVILEQPDVTPPDDTLIAFIRRVHPTFYPETTRLDDPLIRKCLTEFYKIHARRFIPSSLPVRTGLKQIKGVLSKQVIDMIGGHFATEESKTKVYPLVYSGMRLILGVQDGEKLEGGSRYDSPECHAILTRPEVMKDIRDWVAGRLIANGYCPSLSAGFAIHADEGVAADAI